MLNGPLGINFSEILIEIDTFSFKRMHLKMHRTSICVLTSVHLYGTVLSYSIYNCHTFQLNKHCISVSSRQYNRTSFAWWEYPSHRSVDMATVFTFLKYICSLTKYNQADFSQIYSMPYSFVMRFIVMVISSILGEFMKSIYPYCPGLIHWY